MGEAKLAGVCLLIFLFGLTMVDGKRRCYDQLGRLDLRRTREFFTHCSFRNKREIMS